MCITPVRFPRIRAVRGNLLGITVSLPGSKHNDMDTNLLGQHHTEIMLGQFRIVLEFPVNEFDEKLLVFWCISVSAVCATYDPRWRCGSS